MGPLPPQPGLGLPVCATLVLERWEEQLNERVSSQGFAWSGELAGARGMSVFPTFQELSSQPFLGPVPF